MREPFSSWLSEVCNDEVTVSPHDINLEANSNLWTFSLSAAQAAVITPSEVEEFVRECAATRRELLKSRGVKPGAMRFYCWHDEQAAQLRMSLVSATYRRLPFRCAVTELTDISNVARSFLHSRYHSGIPWNEFEQPGDEPIVGDPALVLAVWSVWLP